MKISKYHALGNTYLVIEPGELAAPLTVERIRELCSPHYGLGSDGILLGPGREAPEGPLTLRIFNPDGSEAEKSGNGLRIFARYLGDTGQAPLGQPFPIATRGGLVSACIQPDRQRVTVEMGKISFDADGGHPSAVIPVAGPRRAEIEENLLVGGETLRYCAVNLGNPHCVILCDTPATPADAHRLGPLIENEARFPNRTNVQFLSVRDRTNIQIEIWERGAGYTLASGSSSCAAAAVAHRLGWCDADITVHTPGGQVAIHIAPDFTVTQSGPVAKICEAVVAA